MLGLYGIIYWCKDEKWGSVSASEAHANIWHVLEQLDDDDPKLEIEWFSYSLFHSYEVQFNRYSSRFKSQGHWSKFQKVMERDGDLERVTHSKVLTIIWSNCLYESDLRRSPSEVHINQCSASNQWISDLHKFSEQLEHLLSLCHRLTNSKATYTLKAHIS